jgi:hypothetical protein
MLELPEWATPKHHQLSKSSQAIVQAKSFYQLTCYFSTLSLRLSPFATMNDNRDQTQSWDDRIQNMGFGDNNSAESSSRWPQTPMDNVAEQLRKHQLTLAEKEAIGRSSSKLLRSGILTLIVRRNYKYSQESGV